MSDASTSYSPPRRFAVARLHLPDGRILKQQVIECIEPTADGPRYRFFPLTQEIAFTEWRGGDFYLTEQDL